MEDPETRGARAALVVLLVLVVLAPWPFGSAHPKTTQAIALISLLASLAWALLPSGRLSVPRAAAGALVALWVLALVQLVPLPETLHRVIAPGSAAVWHPSEPAAAAVLGTGPHPISLDPDATRRWLALTTGLVAIALVAAPALATRRRALRSSVAVVTGASAVALYALVARLVFGNKLFGVLAVPTIAPLGPFVSKNHFAGYVEMAACLAVGLAVGLVAEGQHRDRSWLAGPKAIGAVFASGAAGLLVLAVPVSLSRGGVVSLAAGLLAFAGLHVWSRTRHLARRELSIALVALGLVAVLALSLVLVLPTDATERIGTLAALSADSSGTYRTMLWRDSLRLAATSPLLGSGFGAFEEAIPRFKSGAGDVRVEHAENDYLELLSEGGLVGIAAAGLVLWAAFGLALRRIREAPHRLCRALRCGALAGMVALLVHSAFDFNLRIPSNALLFALLAAFALAPAQSRPEPDGPPQRRPFRGLPLLASAVLAATTVLAFATPWTGRRLDVSKLVRAAAGEPADLRRQSLERETIAHLRRRPADAAAWVALAWLRRTFSAPDAAALMGWGVGLDPRYDALRQASRPR